MATVGWPGGSAVVDTSKDDLLEPVKTLLEELGVKENRGEAEAKAKAGESPFVGGFGTSTTSETPLSLQVISAGTLQFSRSAARIITYFGGTAAVLSAIRGFFFTPDDPQLAMVYVGAAAVVLAAAVVAVAT